MSEMSDKNRITELANAARRQLQALLRLTDARQVEQAARHVQAMVDDLVAEAAENAHVNNLLTQGVGERDITALDRMLLHFAREAVAGDAKVMEEMEEFANTFPFMRRRVHAAFAVARRPSPGDELNLLDGKVLS